MFIYKNNVVAGISAKRDPTKIGAIKTALFTKDVYGARICPEGTEVINPAFDITPKELVTGIIKIGRAHV